MPFTEIHSFHFNFKTKGRKGSWVKSEALEFPTITAIKNYFFQDMNGVQRVFPYIQPIENERWGEGMDGRMLSDGSMLDDAVTNIQCWCRFLMPGSDKTIHLTNSSRRSNSPIHKLTDPRCPLSTVPPPAGPGQLVTSLLVHIFTTLALPWRVMSNIQSLVVIFVWGQ